MNLNHQFHLTAVYTKLNFIPGFSNMFLIKDYHALFQEVKKITEDMA